MAGRSLSSKCAQRGLCKDTADFTQVTTEGRTYLLGHTCFATSKDGASTFPALHPDILKKPGAYSCTTQVSESFLERCLCAHASSEWERCLGLLGVHCGSSWEACAPVASSGKQEARKEGNLPRSLDELENWKEKPGVEVSLRSKCHRTRYFRCGHSSPMGSAG